MTNQEKETPEKSPETPSVIDLANGWLNYKKEEARLKIKQRQATVIFLREYKYTTPLKRSDVEPGTMDESDWKISKLEYDDWQEVAELEIEAAEVRLDEAYNELTLVMEYSDKVKNGDLSLIQRFAKSERERQEKIEAEKKAKEEREKPKNFEGKEKLISNLEQIVNSTRAGEIPKYKIMDNGWELSGHYIEEKKTSDEVSINKPELLQFRYHPEQGKESQITVGIHKYKDGYKLGVEDFRNSQNTTYKGWEAVTGIGYSLDIRDGEIYNPSAGGILEHRHWGYGEKASDSEAEIRQFDQEYFNEVNNIIASLADIKKES